MAVAPLHSESFSRGARMLRTALGPAIAAFLADASIVEVMLNPDGRIWIDRLSGGLENTGEVMSPADGERIVRLVAHHVGAEVHAGRPRVSAELPETGERFEGLLPPVVGAPAFAIRKPAVAIFTLDDYAAAGIMTDAQALLLRQAVNAHKNILVAGGTGTGKTTLTNALLAEVAKGDDRVVLIEDTRELQCKTPNLVAMRTKDGVASLSDLVRSSLRLRPDRKLGCALLQARLASARAMRKAARAVAKARIPVLIVTGGWSPTFDAVGEVSAELAHGRHVIVQSPNHFVQLMAAEAFNETAASFIQMAERSGAGHRATLGNATIFASTASRDNSL